MTNDVSLSVVGTRRTEQSVDIGISGINCVGVAPSKPSGLLSLLSLLPRDAYNLGTHELALALSRLLEQDWDWIVIDHAYSSGLLTQILKGQKQASICYIAHNAEGKVRPEIAKSFTSPLRRTIMRIDAEKYRRLEHNILRAADAVVCITEDDASYFRQFIEKTYVIPPVFLGVAAPTRIIDSSCPRALLLLGSFEWVAKRKNLELIIDALLPSFKFHGITLNVVGAVPQVMLDQYTNHGPHLIFHGRIADVSNLLNSSRGGLVPDLLGGGFKLKTLDYGFARLPIFGLKVALSGTTPREQATMFLAENLADLAQIIVENINDLDKLNQNQANLFNLFSERFGLDRGMERMREVFMTDT